MADGRAGGPKRPGGRGAKRQRRGGQGKAATKRFMPVRRGQLISPFGVGAITDFRNDEAMMCAGLDAWFNGQTPPDDSRIREERLQQKLGKAYFVLPPAYSESDGGSKIKIPYVRFPLWHYCPRCFRMKKAGLFGAQPRCDSEKCAKGVFRPRMIPSRIVAICEHGHIEDFPYQKWIGCACPETEAELYFKAGRSSASLAGIKIECKTCGKVRSLGGAFNKGVLFNELKVSCSSGQPWFGQERGDRACGCALQTVQRGGLNVYFPLVASSIYIPPRDVQESDAIRKALDVGAVWSALTDNLVDGHVNRDVCKFLASVNRVDAEALYAAAEARLNRTARPPVSGISDEDFRRQEYEILCEGLTDPLGELFCEPLPGERYGWLGRYVKRVGLVRRLRETRALVGFSRSMPRGEREEGLQSLSLGQQIDWLPAVEVRGEGLFIEFRGDAIADWLDAGVRGHVAQLISRYNQRRIETKLARREVDARFILLHTIAHALIKEMTFTCGYGSASLRERLYCNLDDRARPMNGILIYTASGDSEGTLGGLVNEGRPGRFEALVEGALRRSRWCSNDPVCIEAPGKGADGVNLAACHGCVLLPETSCEEGNKLLDRTLLVGGLNGGIRGFFRQPE